MAITRAAVGHVLPPGPIAVYRAAHKHEPRRRIAQFGDASIPLTNVPHLLVIKTALHGVSAQRTVQRLAHTSDSVASQTATVTVSNSQLSSTQTLYVIDHLSHLTLHGALPTKVNGKSTVDCGDGSEEHEVEFGVETHEHHRDTMLLQVVPDGRNESIRLTYTIQYQVQRADNDNDDSDDAPASSAPAARSSGARRKVKSETKKSGWFS
eukprot:TRINITY_DN909_c0_g1_i1.p3 TRINITY_DN909_c0_g1~~TRINITY_DN909_c0_g1_i1.p3  ORF type:complete len:209 (+),score=100.59 TRINITY_DN909_c0_g1_i1:615-1241(+)